MRLRDLCQVGEEVCLERIRLAFLQLLEHLPEMPLRELSHVSLVVTRDFLTFGVLGEEISVEFTHTAETCSFVQVVELLLGKFRISVRIE